MPKIHQYFSPTKRLVPDNAGYQAFEVAGRRIGPLYRQAAQDISAAGKLAAQGIEDTGKTMLDIFRLQNPEGRAARVSAQRSNLNDDENTKASLRAERALQTHQARQESDAQLARDQARAYAAQVRAENKATATQEKEAYNRKAIADTSVIAAQTLGSAEAQQVAQTHSATEASQTLARLTRLTKALNAPDFTPPDELYHGEIVGPKEKAAMMKEEARASVDPYNMNNPEIYDKYLKTSPAAVPQDIQQQLSYPPSTAIGMRQTKEAIAGTPAPGIPKPFHEGNTNLSAMDRGDDWLGTIGDWYENTARDMGYGYASSVHDISVGNVPIVTQALDLMLPSPPATPSQPEPAASAPLPPAIDPGTIQIPFATNPLDTLDLGGR